MWKGNDVGKLPRPCLLGGPGGGGGETPPGPPPPHWGQSTLQPPPPPPVHSQDRVPLGWPLSPHVSGSRHGHGGDSDPAGREILLPRILTAAQLLRECCIPFDTCWRGLNCQLSRKKLKCTHTCTYICLSQYKACHAVCKHNKLHGTLGSSPHSQIDSPKMLSVGFTNRGRAAGEQMWLTDTCSSGHGCCLTFSFTGTSQTNVNHGE